MPVTAGECVPITRGQRMAAKLERKRAPSNEDDLEVQQSIADTCRKIRLFDLSTALLLLGAVVCFYALAAALFDLLTEGSEAVWVVVVRWAGFALFLVAAGFLFVRAMVQW